jgi:hypothetical protein
MFKYRFEPCLFARKQIPKDADLELDNAVSCLTKRWRMLEHGMVNLHSTYSEYLLSARGHAAEQSQVGVVLSCWRLVLLRHMQALCCRIA